MIALNPRKRFLEEAALARQFRDLVTTEAFQRGCECALAEMLLQKPAANNHAESVTFDGAMEGAKRFLQILLNIAEVPAQPIKRPSQNLNHQF